VWGEVEWLGAGRRDEVGVRWGGGGAGRPGGCSGGEVVEGSAGGGLEGDEKACQ
jgi:hypothetical protein